MAARYLLYCACLILSILSVWGNIVETVDGKVKITIGTTAGCGDTVRFIQNQLLDTYERYKQFLEVEFVPWGRTVWHANDTFICQFSPHNCWANRLHRCVLHRLPEQEAQLRYMACEFTSPSPSWNNGSYACAVEAGLNIIDIDYCVTNPGDELDRAAQIKGTEMLSKINFVPNIVLNDYIDWDRHVQAYNRLKTTICFALASDESTGVTDCQFKKCSCQN